MANVNLVCSWKDGTVFFLGFGLRYFLADCRMEHTPVTFKNRERRVACVSCTG